MSSTSAELRGVCCDVHGGDAFWSCVKTRPAAGATLRSVVEEGLIREPGLRGCSRTALTFFCITFVTLH